jgi:hypothetical protein
MSEGIPFSIDPSSHSISFEITSNQEEDCIITLIDETDKIVKMFGFSLIKGPNKIVINEMHSLHRGYYLLSVRNTAGIVLLSRKIYKE